MASYALISTTLLALTSALAMPQAGSTALPCGANSHVNHTIVALDTLGKLATRYNSGICDIASFNHMANPNLVTPGQELRIPSGCTTPDNTSCLPPPAPPVEATCATAASSAYIIKSGDTLSNIAADYKITLAGLVAANKQIANVDLIFPDQVINIPICPGSQCTVSTYTIKSGDLFIDLAAKHGTTVGNIKGVNLNVDPTKLAIGQTILLPQDCKIVTAKEPAACDGPVVN